MALSLFGLGAAPKKDDADECLLASSAMANTFHDHCGGAEYDELKWSYTSPPLWCVPTSCKTCKRSGTAPLELMEVPDVWDREITPDWNNDVNNKVGAGAAAKLDGFTQAERQVSAESTASSMGSLEQFQGMQRKQPSQKLDFRTKADKIPRAARLASPTRCASPSRCPSPPRARSVRRHRESTRESTNTGSMDVQGVTPEPKYVFSEEPAVPALDSPASFAQPEAVAEALAKLAAVPQQPGTPQKGKAGILLRQRQGPFPPKAAVAALDSSMQRMFWTSCYFEVDCSALLCWKNPSSRLTGKAPDNVYQFSDIDAVAVCQREVALHFKTGGLAAGHSSSDKENKTPESSPRGKQHAQLWLRLCAQTPNEAESWASSIKANAAATLSSILPEGWDVSRMLDTDHADTTGSWSIRPRLASSPRPKRGASAPRMVAKESLPEGTSFIMQRLFDHCFFPKHTKDRHTSQMPLRLEVAEVVRVQNGAAWVEFNKARERLRGRADEGSPLYPSVLTSTLDDPLLKTVLGQLDGDANEQWLFHGSSAQGVQGISDQEFRLDLAGTHRGTLYGKGVYLAECSSKADEYAECDEEGYCTMLLCRAALGRVLRNAEKKPEVVSLVEECKSNYDSLCGDRWAAVGTYREFVFFESAQVYPAFIIRYKRISQAELCKGIAEAAEESNAGAALHVIPLVARLAAQHPDDTIRYQLALVLGTHAGTAVPVLIRGLKDERAAVRRTAARALRQLSEYTASVACTKEGNLTRIHRDGMPAVAHAVPALIVCLKDADEGVSQAAAHALEHVGEFASDAISTMAARMIDRSLSEDTRVAMARALQHLGFHASKTLPVLMAQLAKSDEPLALQVQVARSISEVGCLSVASVETYASYLKSPDADLRVEVARNLYQVARFSMQKSAGMPVSLVPSLVECLSDEEPGVRAAALHSLGQMRMTRVVDDMIRCLRDPDPNVRKMAVIALGRQKRNAAAAAVHTLVSIFADQEPETRVAIADTLSKIGPASATAVTTLLRKPLSDTNVEVRVAVARCLLEMVRLHNSNEHKGLLANSIDLVAQAMSDRVKDSAGPVQKLASACLEVIRGEELLSQKKDELFPHVDWRRTEDHIMKLSLASSPRSNSSSRPLNEKF